MRPLILSLLVLQLLSPGAFSGGGSGSEDRKTKPVMCKDPKAKLGQSLMQGCSQATCKKIGKKGQWESCPRIGLEKTVKQNDENLEKNHEMSLEILKILGNCCQPTTTWVPASTTSKTAVDGKWGNWGSWASCDASTGTKKRVRACDNPPPKNGGASCSGSSQDSATCPVNYLSAFDGKWGNWGSWASCDASTGTKKRVRACDNPPPKNGGASCSGGSQDSAACPVDGEWGNWGSWASCDASTGTKKRVRACDNPPPKNGGASCSGSSQDSATCPGTACQPMWSFPKQACIAGENNKIINNVSTMFECVKLCQDEKSYKCVSVDYKPSTGLCRLSTFNSNTATPSIPCHYSEFLYSECTEGDCALDPRTACQPMWSFPKNACIPGKNNHIIKVSTMFDCVKLCQEEKSYKCVSVDYEVSTGRCHLSTYNSKTATPSIPCHISGYLYSECTAGNCKL